MNPPVASSFVIEDARSDLRFTVPVGQRVVVGRGPNADVLIAPLWASRRHVAFENVDGTCYVERLDALHPMFVGAIPLRARAPMPPGVELAIGRMRLRVVKEG